MPFERPAAGLAAAALLAIAAVPAASGGSILWVPLCHGGLVPVPLPGGGHEPAKPFPAGCHAPGLCQRKGQDIGDD